MKYLKLFESVKINTVNGGNIKKEMLLVLANSLINNSFLKMKGSKTGELMKVTKMEHEDGSGKTFNIYVSIYDANKKYVKSETRFYRLSD